MQETEDGTPERRIVPKRDQGLRPLGPVVADVVGRIATAHAQPECAKKKSTNGSHPTPAAYGPPERSSPLGGPIDLGDGR